MQCDEGIAIVQQRLGMRTDLADAIVSEMKVASWDICHDDVPPWFMIRYTAMSTSSPNYNIAALPADGLFIKEVEELPCKIKLASESEYRVSTKKGFKEAFQAELNDNLTSYEAASFYALFEPSSLQFFPAPTEAISDIIYYHYYQEDTTSYQNNSNEPLIMLHAYPVLINLAGMRVAESISNDKAYARFEKEYLMAKRKLDTMTQERLLAGEDAFMGYRAAEE